MLHIHSSIEIRASLAEVFRLLCDPERKTRLNPAIELLHAVPVTPGALAVGSRIFYSLRTRQGQHNFHCQVTAFEPNRLIEWVSDTVPSFRVRQTLEPDGQGCRLLHDEWLTVARAEQPAQPSLSELAGLLRRAAGLDAPSMPAPAEEGIARLQTTLEQQLGVWLGNIKAQFEGPEESPAATFETIATLPF